MEFQLSYSKSWMMMLWKCYSQYASKFGKLSSGHRTGKGQFSFQSQRRAMPKNVLLLLLLSRFSHVRLCATPWTAAHQVSPSMGFSRQEHFLLQCMKVKSESEVAQSCPTRCDPIDGSPPGSPVPGILQARTFPSPMHESEKWKWSRSVLSDPQRPYGLQPTRLLRPWDFSGKSTGVGCHCLLRELTASCHNLKTPPKCGVILFYFPSFLDSA